MRESCDDDRFELIGKAKARLLEATNIEMRPDEMAVIDSILFRCWQMGWLDQLRDSGTRWHELFGTPERAARIVVDMCDIADSCPGCPFYSITPDGVCGDYYALLQWLEGADE